MAFSTAAAVNPSTSLTDDQLASRFLAQATFGPTTESIAELRALGLDYRRWIDEQANLPASSAVALIEATGQIKTIDQNQMPSTNRRARNEVMLAGRDQLRQRVAYAFSQIMVVSDYEGAVSNAREGSSSYYDMLARNALGNFRALMLDVTRHPMMGRYLTFYKNPKGNATAGTQPDENYAREVMQLCTIGLYQLAADGTILTDPTGRALETYSNSDITEFARVFTGFTDANSNPTGNPNPLTNGAGWPILAENYTQPMMMWEPQHDQGSKRLLSYPGARKPVLPANQGGLRDVEDAIDNLIEHPSTAPFISRQLIQRLVSSNPSPGYIARVAAVFVDNGAGVRGDLLAVVRAILLDDEARSTASIGRTESGKLKEPFLRMTGLLRACRFQAPAGALTHDLAPVVTDRSIGQFPLSSPSVFNFYSPEHRPPGPLADAGLVGPEFQILTSVFAVTFPNAIYTLINNGIGGLKLDLGPQESLADNPAALVENLNLLLAHGTLSNDAQARLVAAINSVNSAMVPTGSTLRETRARLAVYLVAIAPETAVSK